MARISISLPDSLMAKLEPIKDGINVSQICREALERRVAAYERAANRNGHDLDLDDLVQRLTGELEIFGGKFEQLGRDNATTWLTAASYVEIQGVAEHNHTKGMHKYKLPRPAFSIMQQDMHNANLSPDGPQATVYKTAWQDRVKSVWTEVVDRLEAASASQTNHSEE